MELLFPAHLIAFNAETVLLCVAPFDGTECVRNVSHCGTLRSQAGVP